MIRAFLRVVRSIGDPCSFRVSIRGEEWKKRGRRELWFHSFSFFFSYTRVYFLWLKMTRIRRRLLEEKRRRKRKEKKTVARCPDVTTRESFARLGWLFAQKWRDVGRYESHVTLARPLASCLICIQCYEYRMSIRVQSFNVALSRERPFARVRRWFIISRLAKGSETSSSRRLEEPTLLLLSLIYPYRSPRGVNRGSRDLSSRFGAEKR